MKRILKRMTKKNINETRTELAHAHMIIALLSIAIIALLVLGSAQPITFEPTLSAISATLLILVTIFSLCVSVTFYRKK